MFKFFLSLLLCVVTIFPAIAQISQASLDEIDKTKAEVEELEKKKIQDERIVKALTKLETLYGYIKDTKNQRAVLLKLLSITGKLKGTDSSDYLSLQMSIDKVDFESGKLKQARKSIEKHLATAREKKHSRLISYALFLKGMIQQQQNDRGALATIQEYLKLQNDCAPNEKDSPLRIMMANQMFQMLKVRQKEKE